MAEYLHYQEPSWLQQISLDEMLRLGRVIAPAVLRQHILPEAKDVLLKTEGPNWSMRQILGVDWMEAISERLPNSPDEGGLYADNYRLTAFDQLRCRLETHRANGKTSGGLFMATGEANTGHLWAWDWMDQHVYYAVGLFEPDSYFDLHPSRRKPFLPLKVRLSIACHLNLYASVLAERRLDESDATYYQRMFDLSGADYCFASEDDPHCYQKIGRGKQASFLVIPDLDTPHTSDAAEKLMVEPEDMILRRLRPRPE